MPSRSTVRAVATIGIDMGKNTLHMVGLDSYGAIVLREKVSRGRIVSPPASAPVDRRDALRRARSGAHA